MSLFERRVEKRLEDPQHRAAYFAADAEAKLIDAVNHARKSFDVSQRELGARLGKTQSAVSQFFNSEDHMTVARFVEYLIGLGLAADVIIKEASAGQAPVDVKLQLARRQDAPVTLDHSWIWEAVSKARPLEAAFGRTTVPSEDATPRVPSPQAA